jgi:uncharacterized cupin superfamily protein
VRNVLQVQSKVEKGDVVGHHAGTERTPHMRNELISAAVFVEGRGMMMLTELGSCSMNNYVIARRRH